MRVAVVSDIHANLAALEAVLAEIDDEAPDELWCLGDLVGYGPRPNECTRAGRGARGDLSRREPRPRRDRDARPAGVQRRRGRRGALDARGADRQRPRVPRRARAVRHARGRRALPRERARPDLGVRPLGRDRSGDDGDRRHPLVLVGHSHAALQVSLRDGVLEGGLAPAGHGARSRRRDAGSSTPARSASRATATRGPRGSSSTSTRIARPSAASTYDIARTQAEIRDAGLPELLALRLADGQ